MSLPFDFELLQELTETHGVPGYETRVQDIVRRELDSVVDHVRTDAMGNVIGTVEGGDRSVVVAAHMDEIGFMVKHITDDGFLQLDPLGGWDPRVLKAQRVVVHTETEDLTGIIGAAPPHTMDEEDLEGTPDIEDVYVDLGRSADVVEALVTPGDTVTMSQQTIQVGDVVTGKALDDRASLFTMLAAAQRLDDPDVTVHFAATTQEEVGIRGAQALANDLDADVGIALDVTVANDIPGFDPAEHVTELGAGTAIKLKDSSVITTPAVHRRLQSVAADREIPHQREVLPSGGTDTAGFQRSGGARPVGALSIPTRYLHTVTETAHTTDIEATIELLTAFLETERVDTSYLS